MEVQQYRGDVYSYPLLVLLTATAIAEGLPEGLLIDIVYGLTMSLVHKDLGLDMKRWQCKSRW
eukprot:12562431-Prorocentrum_lima.AAC.1